MILFVVLVNVVPTLAMPDLDPTAIVFFELVHNHAETPQVWRDYNNLDRVIKRVIKSFVPEVYF